MSTKVSTVIPAYNAERTIAEAIDSVLAQQYDDHEIIVVDDGSTDTTAKILEGYGDRVRVISQANRGAAAARNAGVAQSNGTYVAFLDSDDVCLPDRLVNMVAALKREPTASLAFSDYGFMDEGGAEYGASCIGDEPLMMDLIRRRPLPVSSFSSFIFPSTWMIPRNVFERTGGFCEDFKGAGYEDSWMLVVLRDLGEFVYVPQKLTLYRFSHRFIIWDKYFAGALVFIGLVRKRYGREGKEIIRSVQMQQCRSLLSKAAHQMNRGDRIGATRSLLLIARLRPSYFLSTELAKRLFMAHNLRRVRELGGLVRQYSKEPGN